jgi:CheY-like chemotaxis protein
MQSPALTGTPVILLSSADRQSNAAACRQAGVTCYLSKPVKQSELLDAILAALDRSADGTSPSGAAPGRPGLASASCQTGPLSLLLVEDNATNQLLAATLLKKAGHAVATAANGKDALDILSQRRFDAIFMDVQMPEMDGFEATKRIRERERLSGEHTPIIAMTASALKGDRARCLDAGMDAYLSKPIHAAELYRVLAEFAGGKPGPERADSAAAGDRRIDAPARAVADDEPAAEKRPAVTVDKAALLSRLGGREDRLRMIVQVFVNESAGLMARIEEAIKSGDGPDLKLAAHSLKGAVGIFSVPRLVTLAQSLEALGQAGDFREAKDACNRLAKEIRNLNAALVALD